MKIRKCPHCAQHNHFDEEIGLARCWNCGAWSDFSLIKNLHQRFFQRCDAAVSPLILAALDPCWIGAGKVALVVALPIAVFMLLICNSFSIHIVTDLTSSFHSLAIDYPISCITF